MEISILLVEQIIAMFLTMAVGFGVVRAGFLRRKTAGSFQIWLCISAIHV